MGTPGATGFKTGARVVGAKVVGVSVVGAMVVGATVVGATVTGAFETTGGDDTGAAVATDGAVVVLLEAGGGEALINGMIWPPTVTVMAPCAIPDWRFADSEAGRTTMTLVPLTDVARESGLMARWLATAVVIAAAT